MKQSAAWIEEAALDMVPPGTAKLCNLLSLRSTKTRPVQGAEQKFIATNGSASASDALTLKSF